MPKALFLCICAALMFGAPAVQAQERFVLGHGRLFSNDMIGDGKDRWRSGAYAVSRITGPAWTGALPGRFGSIVEYRFRSEVIAPSSLTAPPPGDRRYAGVLSFGIHTHFTLAGAEVNLGGDLVVSGPQTGVGRFQRAAHKVFDMSRPQVLGNQIGNRVHPTILVEAGRSFAISDRIALRPFAEAQAGAETFARAGADMTIGAFGQGALMLRDVTTGQRYRGVAGPAGAGGLSFVMGGDVARVTRSAWLPKGGPAVLRRERTRLRAGLHWQGERSEIFYGVTRLGREFAAQPKGQTVGSLRLRLRF